MRNLVSCWTCVAAMLVFPLAGCSDVSGDGGSGGATGGSSGSGGSGGGGGTVPPAPLLVTATEMESFVPFGGPPLEGVELCETGTTNCATTDAEGHATINLPANEEVSYTLTKEGYLPYLVADVTDDTFLGSTWPMLSDELNEDILAELDIFPPFTGGHMLLRAVPAGTSIGGIAGVTFDLVGESDVPLYQEDVTWVPSYDLTETTATGQGGFVEVAAGEYQADFGGTAANCTPSLAWPGDADNRIRVPIKDGYYTYSSMACDAP